MDNVLTFPLRGQRLKEAIIGAVKEAGRQISATEVAEAIGASPTVVLTALLELQCRGIVRSCNGGSAA
jgi:DNA-binding GntR family transcriptional regulator